MIDYKEAKVFVKISFIFCLCVFVSDTFSFVSNAPNSFLYSEIVSFQTLQISTKSFLDTEIGFLYPEKSVFSNETINTGFYNYITYAYWHDTPLLYDAKVSPVKGTPGNEFEFSVVYLDDDLPLNNCPKVRIFKEDSEILGSPFSLSYVSGSLDKGILFSTKVVLSVPSDRYKFYFFTYDIYNFYTETELINGPIVNTPPQLSFLDQTGFQTNGVEPDFGLINATFTFKVRYIDTDNHEPQQGYPKLYILKQGATVQILTMDYITGVYKTGAVYSKEIQLPPGKYEYYFVAYDILGSQSNILSSTGPIVNRNCELEVLSYSSQVNPSEIFTMKVNYKDIDGDPPACGYPKITFYLNDEIIHQATMQFLQGSFVEGAIYEYSFSFSTVSKNYSFVCEAKDTTGLFDVISTDKKSFVVSTPPTKPVSLTFLPKQDVSLTSKVILKWSSTDPDGNNVLYQLYFGDSLSNMNKIYEGENAEFTLFNLEDNKTYYWYVVAVDDTGRSSTSEVFSFNTLALKNKDKVFNYPNPVNAKKGEKTNIVFYSDENTTAEIYVCSVFGEVLFKDRIQVYKGSNVYEFKPSGDFSSGSYTVVVKIGKTTKKGYILVLNK